MLKKGFVSFFSERKLIKNYHVAKMVVELIQVDSPNVSYNSEHITVDYEYSTTNVKKIDNRLVVSATGERERESEMYLLVVSAFSFVHVAIGVSFLEFHNFVRKHVIFCSISESCVIFFLLIICCFSSIYFCCNLIYR